MIEPAYVSPAYGCSKALDDYVLLGRSGLRVSPLCLGAMTFGADSPNAEGCALGCDFETSKKIFDLYYSKGGNFIDTANIPYPFAGGHSEKFLGDMIGERRSNLVLATKYTLNLGHIMPQNGADKRRECLSGNSRKSLVENLDASLKRMQIGYIDLLYIHAWEYRTPVEEVMRALDDCVRCGKVLYCGVSDTPAWVMSKANTMAHFKDWTPFIALQTRYNMLERSLENDLLPMAVECGLGIVPWGVIAEGFLTGKHKQDSIQPTARTGRIN
ncbi:unnamed protein product, partial [Vitrella brassicaformis CCMP3155]